MATKILASQISGSSSGSWYTRLKVVQTKLKITTTSESVSAGTKITATTMNTFVNRINGIQSNTYGAYANWSSYKPSTVTAGKQITQSATYTKTNNMLTSLETICPNNLTELSGYYEDSNCGDNSDDITNSQDTDDLTTSDDLCEDHSEYDYNGVDYGTFGDNSEWTDNPDDSEVWGCSNDRFGNDQQDHDESQDGCWQYDQNSIEGTGCTEDNTYGQDSQGEGCYNDSHDSDDVTTGNSTYGVVN